MDLIDKISYYCQCKRIPFDQLEDLLFIDFSVSGVVNAGSLSEIFATKF